MKSVIIDKEALEISIDNSALRFASQRIPLGLVDTLILPHDTVLSSKVLLTLSSNDVAVLMISRNSRDFALTLPQYAKNGDLKAAQYRALENRLGYAKYFVGEKIVHHSAYLQTLGKVVELNEWRGKVDAAQSVSELLGVEGSFSRLYFQHYFSMLPKVLHKSKRSKRPPEDPVNAVLSYLYTILYNVITAALYKAGFDPAISALHEPFRSHYALASDFMELFRTRADALCAGWFLEGELETNDFSKKNGVFLRYDSRKKLWPPIKALIERVETDLQKEMALYRAAIS